MSRQCRSRITRGKVAFGNKKNYFYLEGVCNNKIEIDSEEFCNACKNKSADSVRIESRSFDNGIVDGPIPDYSRIYGSKWYHAAVKKYGVPHESHIALAEKVHATFVSGPEPAPAPVHVPVPVPVAAPVPVTRPRAVPQTPPPKKTICVNYIEDEEVIEVDDVTYIGPCSKIVIDGEPVIVSSEDGSVHRMYENGGIGPRIGRWDKEKGLLADTDEESE